ncbi:hypothetical protein [Fibrobacter succinogenes]|uniref:hypothetical protein n=1 Tax=Fibrobacter succinogenes TaxID=833 RepID=UPI0013D5E69B|nr:hypothetical protein [Fibrobacter succinogenes]
MTVQVCPTALRSPPLWRTFSLSKKVRFLGMKFFLAILCLILSSCFCWELSDEHCREENEFFENERERDGRLCTDLDAVEKCKTEQREIFATQQQEKLLNIDSLCRANTEKIKCKDREEYGL